MFGFSIGLLGGGGGGGGPGASVVELEVGVSEGTGGGSGAVGTTSAGFAGGGRLAEGPGYPWMD